MGDARHSPSRGKGNMVGCDSRFMRLLMTRRRRFVQLRCGRGCHGEAHMYSDMELTL